MPSVTDTQTPEQAQAAAELRRAADRYFRVRDNGGDLRGEFPLIERALRDWAELHPDNKGFLVDESRRLHWTNGELVVANVFLAHACKRRTTGTCVPRAKQREKGVASC